jgi:hypothetical protein
MKCSERGLEEDRDVIAVKNLSCRCQMDITVLKNRPE